MSVVRVNVRSLVARDHWNSDDGGLTLAQLFFRNINFLIHPDAAPRFSCRNGALSLSYPTNGKVTQFKQQLGGSERSDEPPPLR